jgi:uncharacterized protein (DUF488 family)
MSSDEFATGLERLEALAVERPTAIMCAEALWWRCHRRLIADALVDRGWRVRHIAARGEPDAHVPTLFDTTAGGTILYRAGDGSGEGD